MNLSIIYRCQGNLKEALKSALKSVEFGANDSNLYLNLGAVYGKMNKIDEAIESNKINRI